MVKTITIREIHEKLSKHYDGIDNGESMNRELHVTSMKDDHRNIGSVFISLDGSPPKGYVICINELRRVNFYDGEGRRFIKMTETILESDIE